MSPNTYVDVVTWAFPVPHQYDRRTEAGSLVRRSREVETAHQQRPRSLLMGVIDELVRGCWFRSHDVYVRAPDALWCESGDCAAVE